LFYCVLLRHKKTALTLLGHLTMLSLAKLIVLGSFLASRWDIATAQAVGEDCTEDGGCDDGCCSLDSDTCVVNGQVTAGAGCTSDSGCECNQGLCTSPFVGNGVGKCVDGTCASNDECLITGCCSADGFCQGFELKSAGAACTQGIAGDSCECKSATCTNSICTDCKDIGEVCTMADDCCFDRGCYENPDDTTEKCCAETDSSKAFGDPHLVGFRGQTFDFTGRSGENYVLLSEDSTLLTMEVYAPVPDLPHITYITGIALSAQDFDGTSHTIHIRVVNAEGINGHHECPTSEPCLAEGVLAVVVDGQPMLGPGIVTAGKGVVVGAVNIPGECRPFGFEKYWARKVREAEAASAGADGRRLSTWFQDMNEWVLADVAATNPVECAEYVQKAMVDGTLFTEQGEHTTFQIVTPRFIIRLNHGKLHQLAMRDPTDSFDLPDHITYQINMALERAVLGPSPQGILGGTVNPTHDANGEEIMNGIEAIRGDEEDYRVSGPWMRDFALHHDEPNTA